MLRTLSRFWLVSCKAVDEIDDFIGTFLLGVLGLIVGAVAIGSGAFFIWFVWNLLLK